MFFFKIWSLFLSFSINCLLRFNSPLLVKDYEVLGRAAFSNYVTKDNRSLKINAFKVNLKKIEPISLDRLSLAARSLFITLSAKAARRRSINFYGYGEIGADTLRKIKIDNNHLDVIGVPMIENPFHAEIPLPPDKDEDYYMEVALELKDGAKYVPYIGS